MKENHPRKTARIVGVGLDGEDGHVRITRGGNFDVYLGSESTHDKLQETCIKLNEKLDRKGKRLEELSRDEFVDLVTEAGD